MLRVLQRQRAGASASLALRPRLSAAAVCASGRAYSSSSSQAVRDFGEHQAAVASAAAAEAPPQTLLDYMERAWSSTWFGTIDTLPSPAGTAAEAPGWFADAFLACQDAFGAEAWVVMLLFGAATRLLTLYFSLYGERATARMQAALPELKEPQEAFHRVYYNDASSAMEVQVAASILKGHRRRVFAAHQTSNLRCLAPLASSPFIMTGLWQASSLCENAALSVGTSSFFWCPALLQPDPLMILPTAFCALTLANFELSIHPSMKAGWMRNVINGARLGCLCVIPVVGTFRSGVCLYFIGMSLVGLLQPLLLRLPRFRDAFGFPPAPPAAGEPEDSLQARVTVQFPTLGHLLNPDTEENATLFTSTAKPRGAVSATSTGRARAHPMDRPGATFAMGANPLMRETPARQDRSPGAATAAGAAAGAAPHRAARSTTGSNFASSGWKAPQDEFKEEDFIPPFTAPPRQ